MKLSTKIAYNTIVQFASKIIAAVLGLVTIAIMTRFLGQHGFGQYTTIITFLSFFGILADLGLTLITVQMISQAGVDRDKILNNLFSLRLVSAALFLGLAPIIVLFSPYDPTIKLGVGIAVLSFVFIALNQILVGLFQKELRMDKVSIAEVVSRVVLLLGVIFSIKFGYGLNGILVVMVIANGVSFLLHYIFSLKYTYISWQFDSQVWKDIIQKSWPLAITIFFNLIYLKADTLILSFIKTQSEVGVYGAAYKVVDVFIIIPFMFAGIVLPVITSSWSAENLPRFKNIVQRSFDFLIILAVPLLIGTQFISERVMIFVAGEDFAISGGVLKILIGAAFLIFVAVIPAHTIIALGKQKKIIGVYVFTAITALVGYLYFIPKFSYIGAAWVTIYSETVIVIASLYYTWKYSGFFPNFYSLLKAGLASVPMVFFLQFSFVKNSLLLDLSLAVIIYFVFLYMFKGISKDDIKSLLNKS